MKEAEELLNRLDNYHKDFRRDRLKIVEEFLEKNVVAPEPRKPREWMVVEKGDAICSCWSGDNHIRVREVLE